MKQFWLTCTFLCVCFLSKGQELSAADSLFKKGNYVGAAMEFERMAFDATTSSEKTWALLRKSYCYKAVADYATSLEILKRIKTSSSDSLRKVVVYEKALLYYLTENYEGSYNELLKQKITSREIDPDLIYLEALDLIAMNQWPEARDLVVSQKEHLDLSDEEIATVFSGKLKPKNTEKAYWLSVFMPGVGQMYSGYIFKGLVSGGINAGLIGFSAYSLYKGYFFTGGMTGVALFYTFYFGGARYARELAIGKNKRTSAALSEKLEATK